MQRNVTFLALLGAILLGSLSCGAEETIRVDLLPPGNARGSAAAGTSSPCSGWRSWRSAF